MPAGGKEGVGARIHPMLSDYREIRAERRTKNMADLGGSCPGVRREWGNKEGESSGGEAEQADQLSLLFVSLHSSESRTGAFSSPSLTDPADEGRSFYSAAWALVSVRDCGACVHRSRCVTFI